jgi:hypothetical protein
MEIHAPWILFVIPLLGVKVRECRLTALATINALDITATHWLGVHQSPFLVMMVTTARLTHATQPMAAATHQYSVMTQIPAPLMLVPQLMAPVLTLPSHVMIWIHAPQTHALPPLVVSTSHSAILS